MLKCSRRRKTFSRTNPTDLAEKVLQKRIYCGFDLAQFPCGRRDARSAGRHCFSVDGVGSR